MEEKKEVKYYISSDGTKKDVTSLNGEYLINALAKKRKTIYECKTKKDWNNAYEQIKILDEEYYRRLNEFHDTLEEE
jgi:hypothetical protein|nr:MAG TPA: hypothetical protein [Caudoviricetes sp.]